MGREQSSVKTCGYPIDMPTSVVLPIPHGGPVLIGGPEACDNEGAIKAALFGLAASFAGKLLKKAGAAILRKIGSKWGSKFEGRLGKWICGLVGDPVDVASGEMIAEAVDVELGGAIDACRLGAQLPEPRGRPPDAPRPPHEAPRAYARPRPRLVSPVRDLD